MVVILLGLVFTLFAAVRGGKQWLETNLEGSTLPPAWTELIRVTVSGGEPIYLEAASIPWVQEEIRERIAARSREAEEALSGDLDRRLEVIFALADQMVPAFADWYYSLKGEYARLFYAATGNIVEYLGEKMEELVLQPAGTSAAIDALSGHMEKQREERIRSAALDIQDLITSLVRSKQVRQEGTAFRVTGEWNLGHESGEPSAPYLSLGSADIMRQGLATSAGVAASAATAKKLGGVTVAKISGKVGMQTSLGSVAGLASKLGLKSAVKAGGGIGGAGTGAARRGHHLREHGGGRAHGARMRPGGGGRHRGCCLVVGG